jgi:hypothetical protein
VPVVNRQRVIILPLAWQGQALEALRFPEECITTFSNNEQFEEAKL